MYSRSPRKSCEPSYATLPSVGPGSYFHQRNSLKNLLKSTASTKNDTKAPFSSTAPRISYFDELAIQSGPSPDTYDPERGIACVPFATTNSPRFMEIKQASPGPAVYNTSTTVNHTIDQADRSRDSGKDQSHQQISWERQHVPPSIPYGPQTAGYDEGPSGELILRKLPDNQSEHLPVHGDFIITERTPSFAKSKTERQAWTQNTTGPGPGSYVVSSKLLQEEMLTVNPNAPFGSISARFIESERALKCKTEMDPGPTSYNITGLPNIHSGGCKENAYRPILARTKSLDDRTGFGTKESRFKPAFHTITPPPGIYDTQVSMLKKPRTTPVEITQSHANQRASYIQPSQGPGPGTYSVTSSLLHPLATPKPSVSFGAASDRFMDPIIELKQKQMIAFPGPASYNLPELSKTKDPKFRVDQNSSNPVHQYCPTKYTQKNVGFGTQASRFMSGYSCTPAPGLYNVNKANLQNKKPSTAPAQTINTQEDGRAGLFKPSEGPGPGEYDPKENQFSQMNEGHAAVAVFVSQLPRLMDTNPAPNTYKQLDMMIKHTFNTSLEGNHYPWKRPIGSLAKPRKGNVYRNLKQGKNAHRLNLINLVSAAH